MAQVIDLPRGSIPKAPENFWLETPDAGIRGLDGRDQVVFTENRYWTGQLDLVPYHGSALRDAVVIGDRLRGRANILRITLCNHHTVRYLGDDSAFYKSVGVSAADIARGYISFSDGTSFDDGTGFALPDHDEPTVVAAQAAGASTLHMDGYLARNLAVAAFFSIDDFLYRVESNTDGVVTFNPPLRHPVPAGAQVDVSYPKVRVRLQSASDWRPFCDYFRNGQPMSINVVEAFDR